MHSITYICVMLASACILTSCANPAKYKAIPDSVVYRTPDWLGGFDYKVRFEPREESLDLESAPK